MKRYVSQSDVPRHSLAEAIRIPRAIADEYGKQPATPVQVGAAIGVQPTTGRFRSLAGAALAYGLTDGGPRVAAIGLTDVGKRIVAPTSEGDDVIAKREAFLRPRVIREFLERYDGSKLPSEQIGRNVLEELGVAADATSRTWNLITEGAEELGLLQKIGSARFVQLKGISVADIARESREEESEEDEHLGEAGAVDDVRFNGAGEEEGAGDSGEGGQPQDTTKARPNAIFVGHGKNKKPRDQLTKLLDQYKIPYKVAEEEANKGRPIPVKVKETMQGCGAAILIFSADEEFKNADEDTVWRPSENVVHELGAASVLYDDRIIIFREESVELATNFDSIGYITFEKNDLTAKFNDLLKELIALGILKLAVND
jgi:hypothetical protein